jgi:KDO2-lipid IV(A) lauroyltransferase
VRKGPDFFIERFRCHNPQLLDQVIEQHGGAIVVVGHLGNWDAAGAWVAARGGRLVTVAEVLKPRRLFEFFLEHRARLGMTIHPAQPRVVSQLVEAVRDGAVVAILGDRDLRNRGPEVQFFSHAVTFPPGPAVVALKTGVPLLVAGVYSVKHAEGRGWEAEISGPIEVESEPVDSPDPEDVRRLTQEVARHLERFVARRPEEWHVFRPFFRRPQSMGRGHEDRRSPQSPFEAPTGAA